jgi:lipoyl-dependent peroxiredoxin
MSVNVLYRTKATAHGGRDGRSRTEDGTLDVSLTIPKELGGPARRATIPRNSSPPAIRPASSAQ